MESIGKVTSIDGTVTVTRVNGSVEELSVGSDVEQGDKINSGPNGVLSITLVDGSTVAIDNNSVLVLDEMIYDPSSQNGSMVMSALTGMFVVVSGAVAKVNPDAMVMNTPISSLGIRGTQVGVSVENGGKTNVVLMRESNGFVGEVVVRNSTDAMVLNSEFQTASLDSAVGNISLSISDLENIRNTFGNIFKFIDASGNSTANRYDTAMNGNDVAGFETAAGNDSGNDVANFDTAAGGRNDVNDVRYSEPQARPGDMVLGTTIAPTATGTSSQTTEATTTSYSASPTPVLQQPAPVVVTETSRTVQTLTDTTTAVSDPNVSTSYEDVITRTIDKDTNKEYVVVTRTYTDTTTITTTTTTTSTELTTVTYSDGTTQTFYSDPFTSTDSYQTTNVSYRTDVISTSIEQPTIETTYNEVIDVTTSPKTLIDQYSETTSDTQKDAPNKQDITTDITVTTYEYDTTTITTKTLTPVYTITYSDGSTETEYGTPIITSYSTTSYSTETSTTTNTYTTAWTFENNGFGNGDDAPPGNSETHNNAENANYSDNDGIDFTKLKDFGNWSTYSDSEGAIYLKPDVDNASLSTKDLMKIISSDSSYDNMTIDFTGFGINNVELNSKFIKDGANITIVGNPEDHISFTGSGWTHTDISGAEAIYSLEINKTETFTVHTDIV